MFQCICTQIARLLVGRVGVDQFFGDLRHPLILALFKILLRFAEDCIGTAQIFYQLLGGIAGRERIQVDRVCVIPAQIFLVNGLGIVRQRTVVRTGIPDLFQFFGQGQHRRDLI